jgi:leader peptidase (prepilin peptidase)/N-methyltransferase
VVADIASATFAEAPSWRLLSLADAVLGAVVGAGFLYGIGMVYRRARGHEGMGMGDVKLMAMIGAFLGLRLTVFTIFGASVLGTILSLLLVACVWRRRTKRRQWRNREPAPVARRRAWKSAKLMRYYALPFGVFLGSTALLAIFFGPALLQWYWNRYF